jgi:hypothetical protein
MLMWIWGTTGPIRRLRGCQGRLDIYIPAPVTMATLIIPAQGILPKDKFTFTVGQTYERFVMFVTVNRDQFGQPWTETCIVQITKE